ncbi:unnamed protein product [uncultured virus]|nr:unnamed protein product [uncultured virus]
MDTMTEELINGSLRNHIIHIVPEWLNDELDIATTQMRQTE